MPDNQGRPLVVAKCGPAPAIHPSFSGPLDACCFFGNQQIVSALEIRPKRLSRETRLGMYLHSNIRGQIPCVLTKGQKRWIGDLLTVLESRKCGFLDAGSSLLRGSAPLSPGC